MFCRWVFGRKLWLVRRRFCFENPYTCQAAPGLSANLAGARLLELSTHNGCAIAHGL